MADEEKKTQIEAGHDTDHDGADHDNKDYNRRNGDTRVGLSLRAIVAVYVLYLAYGLIRDFDKNTGSDRYLIGAAIIVFIVAGGALLIHSVRKLMRKEYLDRDDAE